MINEIYEDPIAFSRTLSMNYELIKKTAFQINEQLGNILYIIGSGTSYHASLSFQYTLLRISDINASAIPASEFLRWLSPNIKRSVVIAVSQSGESIDVINSVREVKEKNMTIVGVTNNISSTLAKLSDVVIPLYAGEEKAIAATKSYVSQLAALFLLALELANVRGFLTRYKDMKEELFRIPDLMTQVLKDNEDMAFRVALQLKESDGFFILGSGALYPSALEASLKIKETCSVIAEGYAMREFLHGPIQLISPKVPIFMLLSTPDDAIQGEDLATRFKSFNVFTVTVGENKLNNSDFHFQVPRIMELFMPVLIIIPVQLFAFYLAIARGLNPDKPEKLKKVVI
ncbi:MAG: SIS domain-containing protein [Thermoprotei archaeon]